MKNRLRRFVRFVGLSLSGALTLLLVGWCLMAWWLEWDSTSSPPATATETHVEPAWTESAARARHHLQRLRQEGNIPGLTAAVMVEGRLVWSEATGYADVNENKPTRRNTRFRIQSLSKTLTATGLMRLHETGRLRLDEPVHNYVPSYPAGDRITATHLASHRSGIRQYRDDREALHSAHCETALEAVALFRNDPLTFPPGTDSVYSNFGYQLLGAQMESAASTPFPLLMRALVFEPLHMNDTSEFRLNQRADTDSRTYDFVTPYSSNGRRVESPVIDFTCRWPSGGFLSTADDMVRFAAAHSVAGRNRFLTPATLRVLFEPRTPPHSPVGFAMGWINGRDWRLRTVAFNFGAGSGGRGFLALYPEQDVALVILANLGHARMDMSRLCRIAAPFLQPSRALLPELTVAIALIGWGLFVRRRIRAR